MILENPALARMTGLAILLLLGVVYFAIAGRVVGNKKNRTISAYLLADRRIPFGLIGSSVLVSWTWTTTIMGAAEAGMWYGVSGGISYSLGAGIPFLVFVPLVVRFKKIMPQGITYTEFIGARFGNRVKYVYFVFAVFLVIYVFLEQLVGVGAVFRDTFDLPFKLTVALAALIVVSYIIRGGIRGAFYNNVLNFFILFIFLGIIFYSLMKDLGIGFLYDGLLSASQNPSHPNYNPDLLLLNSVSGLKYGIISLTVALGQVLLDQGYYSIAMASASRKDLVAGFLTGAIVAWIPISILCANLFGHGAIAFKLSPGQGPAASVGIATAILSEYGPPVLQLIFALMIFSIGVSTGGNCLIGIMSIFTVDFYSSVLRPDANDRQKIRFGNVITVCVAALCAFIAIALEGISLLRIDMFSGIIFAAPCGVLIIGVYSKFLNEAATLLAVFGGLIVGLATWIYFDLSAESWFFGCLLSFMIPVIVIFAAFPFTEKRFNFERL